MRPDTGWSKIWATISYGWESPDFYQKWSAASDPIEMQGPCLDSLNAQTACSSVLLDLFRIVLQSPDYVERLKRHYRMFRDSLELEQRDGRPRSPKTNRPENKRRRLRDPRRRRQYAR
jgi:hypothetical protein